MWEQAVRLVLSSGNFLRALHASCTGKTYQSLVQFSPVWSRYWTSERGELSHTLKPAWLMGQVQLMSEIICRYSQGWKHGIFLVARVEPVGSIPTRTSPRITHTKIFCVIFLLESMDERMVESYNAQCNIIITV